MIEEKPQSAPNRPRCIFQLWGVTFEFGAGSVGLGALKFRGCRAFDCSVMGFIGLGIVACGASGFEVWDLGGTALALLWLRLLDAA